jgi:hypothetical protein
MEEVRWKIAIRSVNKDLSEEALGRTSKKLSTFH